MQTASTMANLGLSSSMPSSPTMATEGIVLTVMAIVETITNVMEMMLTSWLFTRKVKFGKLNVPVNVKMLNIFSRLDSNYFLT